MSRVVTCSVVRSADAKRAQIAFRGVEPPAHSFVLRVHHADTLLGEVHVYGHGNFDGSTAPTPPGLPEPRQRDGMTFIVDVDDTWTAPNTPTLELTLIAVDPSGVEINGDWFKPARAELVVPASSASRSY